MSTWGVGDDHDSEEVRLLKEQIRAKDAQNATLHGEVLKREAELKEVKDSMTEVLIKLRNDADRVVQLEADIKRRNEDLSNERITRANAEAALTTAERKLKESKHSALELQSTLDTVSRQANSTSLGRSKLEQDNVALQTRVRALERELQNKAQAEKTALSRSHGPSGSRSRIQPPTDDSFRIPVLEKEVAELRATSTQQVSELERTTAQLTRARDQLVQVQNEKIATERQFERQLDAARAALEEREEDLRLLQDARGGEDAAAREAGLLERLEMEEQRVAALEDQLARSAGSRKQDTAMLRDELDRTTQMLDDANDKLAAAESKLTQLTRDRESAYRDRDRLQRERDELSENMREAGARISYLELQLSTASQGTGPEEPSTEEHVTTIERLLHSITRIRSERDGLRRDLEFLNVENKFAVQSLEAKLAAASAPVTPSVNSTQFSQISTLEGYIHILEGQAERTSRTTLALAIVAQRTAEHEEAKAARIQSLLDQLSSARESLQQSERRLQERQGAIESLETQLSSSTSSIGEAESRVAAFRTTIQRLEDELARERHSHVETGAALSDAEAQLNQLSQTLTDAEAARDALALEKTHLEADLDAAREELADVEARHASQLASLAVAGESGRGAQAALRAQVGELQDRVQRRTQQIGEHQHDIKRLETNMKLQEERIAEMTAELDVAQSERVAMLEDCRTTREQRDDAMMRCDELEEAMEALEEAREVEVEAVVKVAFAAEAGRRQAVVLARNSAQATSGDRVALEERIRVVEQEKLELSSRLESLAAERDQLVQRTERELTSTRAQLEEATSTTRATDEAKSLAESQITDLHDELEAKDREITSLRNQLAVAQANHEDRQSLEASLFAQEKAAFETRLQEARTSHSELETLHRETVEKLRGVEAELKRAEDELACQLANGAAHSEAEERLQEEIAQVKQEHAKEIQDLEEQIKALDAEIEAAAHLRREADASKQAVEEELAQTKEQLQSRLAEAGESLDAADRLEAELAQAKEGYEELIRNLNGQLETLKNELQEAVYQRQGLEAQHVQATEDLRAQETATSEAQEQVKSLEDRLVELKEVYEEDICNLQAQLEHACRALEDAKASASVSQRDAVDELTRTIEELQGRLTVLTREVDECRSELDEEKAAHARIRESTTAEMREIMAMRDEAEAALTEAEQELPSLRAQLEHAESSLREVEEEKLSLQYQATNLEAEVQRAKSLQRFLESQAAESEHRIASLDAELVELRAKCTSLDKLAQTKEANLAMQSIQHEQTIASLKRELNALRTQPRFEDELAELKEKNAEYEELLRAKCLEIEENDDKFIDMLKEKKKLNTKIDSLNRKVQNLQTKLNAAAEAAAKASSPPPAPPPKHPAVFSPSPAFALAPAPIISGASSASTSRPTPSSRQRVVTAPASRFSPENVAPPPMPPYRPKTPESRSRMTSGSSSSSRPKTPESRPSHMPVFKARTPERHRVPTTIKAEAPSSSSLIGVKRRAPDDFDDCGTVPPQTFTADSAPSGPSADGSAHVQPTTPRLRKALQSMRSGFTPVRHTTSRAGSASPRRATTGGDVAAPLPHTISDVTNSPRAASHSETGKAAAKKGWLGKIKAAPSSQPRGYTSRPPVFGPPGMR
ncbi:transporter [Ganoderma sinense ZZ0214-1]|uniref:Transporter n=1 Tax=Ganoderma sinense ZZ0214-1 TaxID=1077348 RepID=A0A2G8SC88_9APHY|nr:transporter [Ganoderma sinense ZZ0214-1]